MTRNRYRLEILNNQCMPGAMSVNCHAHLTKDVGPALPYLNAVLGGFEYIKDPPSVTFRAHGKLISIHGRKISINALKDETEAQKIVDWLLNEIDAAWQNRHHITPKFEGLPRPAVIEILKRLPKTNCRKCGAATCLVFATQLAEGAKGVADCPPMSAEARNALGDYLAPFRLDD